MRRTQKKFSFHSREIQTKPIELCLSANKTMYFIQRFLKY